MQEETSTITSYRESGEPASRHQRRRIADAKETGKSMMASPLRDQEDVYVRLLDDISDGIYTVDPDMRITYMNAAGTDISGYPSSSVIGHQCQNDLFVHIDTDGKKLCHDGCPMKATLKDGKHRESFVFLKHRQGHRVPVEVRISALHDAEGRRTGAVQVFRCARTRYALERRAREMEAAVHQDALTGVSNRRKGQEVLEDCLQQLETRLIPAGVLYCDIDHFKRVNDQHGHAAGDEVLKMVAGSLRSAVREQDTVVRWGGEEFVCILPGADEDVLRVVGERIRVMTARSYFMHNGLPLSVTISIGAAVSGANDTSEHWLSRADSALYLAKHSGRDRLVISERDAATRVEC